MIKISEASMYEAGKLTLTYKSCYQYLGSGTKFLDQYFDDFRHSKQMMGRDFCNGLGLVIDDRNINQAVRMAKNLSSYCLHNSIPGRVVIENKKSERLQVLTYKLIAVCDIYIHHNDGDDFISVSRDYETFDSRFFVGE